MIETNKKKSDWRVTFETSKNVVTLIQTEENTVSFFDDESFNWVIERPQSQAV